MNTASSLEIGKSMYRWVSDLYPITRSLTGQGVRETLSYIKNLIPGLNICEVPSGTRAFDWTVPDEWSIRDAFISDETGRKIIDFKEHNLHVVGYSVPVDRWMECDELENYLHSIPEQPDAIPYITSFYEKRWGFCLTHTQRTSLGSGKYRAFIDSDLKPGVLNYGELILPGEEEEEVLLSTYVCHPSMANNELSGPAVTTALAQYLAGMEKRRYTYRILFLPETIGSIVYLSRHVEEMKKRVVAGFVVTCVGDDRSYSFIPSRLGNTLVDRVAVHMLDHFVGNYKKYSFLERRSDERQYCSPLIDLPVVSIMRSKYGTFPEYHTSLDDLSFINEKGLAGAYTILRSCLSALEKNYTYCATHPCEPNLGKRGLYPTLSSGNIDGSLQDVMNFLAYADGKMDLLEIAEKINLNFEQCADIAGQMVRHGLVKRIVSP